MYSLSSFQVYNTVLLDTVTVQNIRYVSKIVILSPFFLVIFEKIEIADTLFL